MPGDTNTNQTPSTINLPDESDGGVENPPPTTPQQPDEHVPPVEVPGRTETPEHIPEKSQPKSARYPKLIKS